MSITLRRSPRLAEKVTTPPAVIAPVAAPVAKPKRKTVPRTVAKALVRRYLTEQELANELSLRQRILAEAKVIRRALGTARTREDFMACRDLADEMWHTARNLVTGGLDEMFISDCCRWCHEAKLGAIEHQYAINVLKVYMSCVQSRITEPPTWVGEYH